MFAVSVEIVGNRPTGPCVRAAVARLSPSVIPVSPNLSPNRCFVEPLIYRHSSLAPNTHPFATGSKMDVSSRQLIDAQFDRAVEIVQGLPKTGPIQTAYEDKLNMYRCARAHFV